jgi:hypothetical protein
VTESLFNSFEHVMLHFHQSVQLHNIRRQVRKAPSEQAASNQAPPERPAKSKRDIALLHYPHRISTRHSHPFSLLLPNGPNERRPDGPVAKDSTHATGTWKVKVTSATHPTPAAQGYTRDLPTCKFRPDHSLSSRFRFRPVAAM